MNVSNTFILLLITSYFIIGGIGMLFYVRKVDNERRKYLWTKYVVYVFIIYSILLSLMLLPWAFLYLTPMIIALGFWEVEKVTKYRLLTLFFYLLIAVAFIGFVQNAVSNPAMVINLYVLILTFDGFSQITGQLIGGPKLAPIISPNKTISGFLGGLISALITAFGLNGFTIKTFQYAIIIIAAGFAGDLLASYVKRKSGLKDFSNLIPGHGGVLDRFDSFIVAGAVMCIYIFAFPAKP